MNNRKRAAHYGVEHEHIDRFAVFAEDNYICQICKRKAKRKYPHPRSPTIDHIIPLSKGGPDLRHNVQTACLECNVQKHNGAANDQLRLALAS
jgi:5-methylcytosine-specific restriction endonuclease McrA